MADRSVLKQLGISVLFLFVMTFLSGMILDVFDEFLNPNYNEDVFSTWVSISSWMAGIVGVAVELVAFKTSRISKLANKVDNIRNNMSVLKERETELILQAQSLSTHYLNKNRVDQAGNEGPLEKSIVESIPQFQRLVAYSRLLNREELIIHLSQQMDELQRLMLEKKLLCNKYVSLYNQAIGTRLIRVLLPFKRYAADDYFDK